MTPLRFIRDNRQFLAAGVILMFTSSYGQTFFVSTFAAQIMAAFSLSDGQWGLVYTLGTTVSAIVMFWAGALTDRFRVRQLAWIVLPGLALACFFMAINTAVAGLVVCVFLLRFFGQGMMYQLAAVAMARWFVARRGLALSVSTLGISLGTAALPVLVAALFEIVHWRTVWGMAGIATILTFPVLLLLLSRERTPQSHAEEASAAGMNGRHWTRKEVLKSSLFLMLLPILVGPPAWGTSLFFQQVHIAMVKGWPLVSYLSLIPILTVVLVVVTLISGVLIDRFGSGRMMQLYVLPYAIGFLVLSLSSSLAGAAVAFVLFGVSMGMGATIVTAFWAEYYGTRYIGAIKATSTSIMVFGSAIGPGISGVLIDAGFTFPDQMVGISVYFLVAAGFARVAIARAQADLAVPGQVDVKGA
ncbi:MAG: MFS transporter [Silicimonas sp.]|nr:MFS transporter [Silicimonas sp.]